MVNISDRPVQARDRAVPGFWEGDLIIGTGARSQIATLVQRSTQYTMLVRVPFDRTADRGPRTGSRSCWHRRWRPCPGSSNSITRDNTASGTRFATAMLRLERAGSVTHVWRPATGAWSYDSGVSYWALTPTPGQETLHTWVQPCTEIGRNPQCTDDDRTQVAALAAQHGPTGVQS